MIAPLPITLPYVIAFNATHYTSVPYGPEIRQLLGDVPTIQVAYFDTSVQKYVMNNNPMSKIVFEGNSIGIDHGGVASGIIKIL